MNRRHFSAATVAALLAAAGPWATAQQPAGAPRAPLLILGDSLSAEYGLQRGEGWVALLQQRLQQQKIAQPLVNASISGETSAGGRARLAALLRQHQPRTVVIELGANDALRGLPVAQTEANLAAMVQAAQGTKAQVLLVGIQVPPNYGAAYSRSFAQVFTDVAQRFKVPLVPFMLAGVADGADAATLFQADRIHPLAAAHPRILDNIWPALSKLLR